MNDWKVITLADCASFQEGYVNPSKNEPSYFGGTIKWLRATDLNNGFVYKTSQTLTEKGFLSAKKSAVLFEPDSLAISKSGTIGRIGILKDYMCGNRAVINIKVNENICNPLFIFYTLLNSKEQIETLAEGSVQKNLYVSALSKVKLLLPDINKQKEIGYILNTLDQKIKLNTQINQTLEQIAQALFKSWFVDFDPVRAKVQALSDGLSLEQAELAAMQTISGKTPKELTALSQAQPDRYAELAETAKAFPCEMVEVDGVEVPKGWRIGTFTDITESRREKVKNDKAMVLSAVSSGELVKSEEYFTKQVFSKSIDKYLKVYKWDFVYNPARINIGSIGLHEADYLGAVSPVYEVFSVSDKYHWFLKRILNLETTKIKIQSLCTGSVRQTLKLKDFQSIDCVIPDEKTLSIFNKKWEEYRTLILENNKNTQTLSEIRDLLLPRLLSGKIEND